MKLSKKLTLSFTILLLISIFIISLISNLMISNRFEMFLINEQEDSFNTIHKDINDLIVENDFIINNMDLSQYARNENINIEIKNSEGISIYNSGGYRNNHHMGMHMGMMHRNDRIPEGNYVEEVFPLADNNRVIGTLIIGHIDNSYLTNSALIFKDTLSKSFLVSGLITIVLGLIISIYLSKALTSPIINITNTANSIKDGNLKARSNIETNTYEILQLADSVNYLGNSLSQQEEIRIKYAEDISHELRTPLTTLKSHLEAIIDGVWEPTREHLDILMNEISRLSNLVDDLKGSFTHEEYSIKLNKSNFNISTILENIVIGYIPIYKQNNYSINYSIEENITIEMDKDKFTQIINNLLSNSLKSLKDDGEVFVELYTLENFINIKIKDNGIGIKEENLPFIFERFYRTDSSRNKETGGTGLGLPIVKSIVEAHNGNIKVNSIYNLGTEFIITLPQKS